MHIQFTDIYGKVKGSVLYEDGKLIGTNDKYKNVVHEWLSSGKTAEEFVEKYQNWSNGYAKSEIVPE